MPTLAQVRSEERGDRTGMGGDPRSVGKWSYNVN